MKATISPVPPPPPPPREVSLTMTEAEARILKNLLGLDGSITSFLREKGHIRADYAGSYRDAMSDAYWALNEVFSS